MKRGTKYSSCGAYIGSAENLFNVRMSKFKVMARPNALFAAEAYISQGVA